MISIWIESSKCKTSSYHTHLHIYRTYNGLFSTNACFVGNEVAVNRMLGLVANWPTARCQRSNDEELLLGHVTVLVPNVVNKKYDDN